MERLLKVLEVIRQGGYPCLFYIFTGAYCPGCGGTRAVRALFRGEIKRSFLYHPFVLYVAIAAPLLFFYWWYCRKKSTAMRPFVWNLILFLGAAILVFNVIVKNYALMVLHTDLLKMLDSARP